MPCIQFKFQTILYSIHILSWGTFAGCLLFYRGNIYFNQSDSFRTKRILSSSSFILNSVNFFFPLKNYGGRQNGCFFIEIETSQ
jgi:hypothetical protein